MTKNRADRTAPNIAPPTIYEDMRSSLNMKAMFVRTVIENEALLKS